LTLRQANALVAEKHRHHKPVHAHRFSIGVELEGRIVGAAITGRPVARLTPQYSIAEVTRMVADGTPHVCSMLYAASARAAQAMGYEEIQTFILASESGISLRAAGWARDENRRHKGGKWTTRTGRDGVDLGPKQRWFKRLNQV